MSDQIARRQSAYQEFHERRTRGIVLLILSAVPGERSSAGGLRAMFGAEASSAGLVDIEAAMRWLAAEGYVVAEDMAGELVAAITDRGIDVVERREHHQGITLPRRK